MKYLYIPLLFSCALALGAVPASAAIATKTATPEFNTAYPVADATVNLYCRLTAGKKVYTTSGSGVFISDRGVILTNAHVAQYFLIASEKSRIKGKCSVRTGSPAKDAYIASVLYLPASWVEANADELRAHDPKGTGEGDFALLYVTGAKKGTLPLRFPFVPVSYLPAVAGESVTVSGYPTEGLDTSEIKKKLEKLVTKSTIGNIRSFLRGSPDIVSIASESAASAGISGGPIVTSSGLLAGIIVAKSDATVRAITPFHLNSVLAAQTRTSLPTMLSGDLKLRADANRLLITPKLFGQLQNGLLRRK